MVTTNDLKRFGSNKAAVDFSTANIGGAVSATQLSGGTVGETLFSMPSTAEGSGDGPRVQYGKEFWRNTHATDSLSYGRVYLANALDTWGAGTSTVQAGSSSVDDTGRYLRLVGLNLSGAPVQHTLALNGTTQVTGVEQMGGLYRATLHDATTHALVQAAGDITISRTGGATLGIIPAGFRSATGEIDLWVPATLNDTGTTTDAGTQPAGASWSRPRTAATGLPVAGELTAGAAQGYWLRWTVAEGQKPSADVEYVIGLTGDAV